MLAYKNYGTAGVFNAITHIVKNSPSFDHSRSIFDTYPADKELNMSDKSAEKAPKKEAAEKTATAEGKKDNGNKIVKKADVKRVERAPWTLERCLKYSRRYPTEAIWASTASASYKSAVAHGWRDQCLAEMQKLAGTVVTGNFKKPTSIGPSRKAA